MEFIKPENLTDTKIIESPTGRHILTIGTYKTGEKSWSYTYCTITRKQTNEVVTSIMRNYSFEHSFFIKNNCEWLQTGSTYMSQVFVNMDTGDVYDNKEELKQTDEYKNGRSFCWVSCTISPTGNTLAVYGCYWGWTYEYKFFDVTDISVGWLELKLSDPIYDNSLMCYETKWDEVEEIFTVTETCQYIEFNGKLMNLDDEDIKTVPHDFFDDDANWIDKVERVLKYKRVGDAMTNI